MPRAKEPSAAVKWLVGELATRDVVVTPRAVEDWAAKRIAYAPARRSLGRGRGMTSEYPPGVVDHYAAVASVMRRGRPWQASVLMLVARGHLPADPALIGQALHELLTPSGLPSGGDALDRAEHAAAQAAARPRTHPFLRAFERNLRRASGVLEPGTQVPAAAQGVLATLNLMAMGEPAWSGEALMEMHAAYGFPIADLSEDERDQAARATDALLTQVITTPALGQLAHEVTAERLLAAVPRGRDMAEGMWKSLGNRFPRPPADIAEVLTVVYALMLLRIEDFGGDAAIALLFQQAQEA